MVVSVTGPRAANELGGPVIPGNGHIKKKITDFFMILAWGGPFKQDFYDNFKS